MGFDSTTVRFDSIMERPDSAAARPKSMSSADTEESSRTAADVLRARPTNAQQRSTPKPLEKGWQSLPLPRGSCANARSELPPAGIWSGGNGALLSRYGRRKKKMRARGNGSSGEFERCAAWPRG